MKCEVAVAKKKRAASLIDETSVSAEQIREFVQALELGIIPECSSQRDHWQILRTMSADERTKAMRRFRKLWRQLAKKSRDSVVSVNAFRNGRDRRIVGTIQKRNRRRLVFDYVATIAKKERE